MNNAQREVEHLKVALEHRTVIGIALGMLIERYDISRDQAFAHLRRISSTRETKLYDVACELVEDRALLDDPTA